MSNDSDEENRRKRKEERKQRKKEEKKLKKQEEEEQEETQKQQKEQQLKKNEDRIVNNITSSSTTSFVPFSSSEVVEYRSKYDMRVLGEGAEEKKFYPFRTFQEAGFNTKLLKCTEGFKGKKETKLRSTN